MGKMIKPDFVFEISWEVCNKIGGIYAVLSTKAKSMVKYLNNNVLFIGPEFNKDADNKLFIAEEETDFLKYLQSTYSISARIGKWDIPGSPKALLVDFSTLYSKKNDIYSEMWQEFGVDSLQAGSR